MKYRPRASDVDAIQVRFGSQAYPKWLEGTLAAVGEGGEAVTLRDGAYIVHHGDGVVSAMSPGDFETNYSRVRTRASTAQEATDG